MTRAQPRSAATIPDARRRGLQPWQVVFIASMLYLALIGLRYRNVLEFVRLGASYAGQWGTYTRDADGYDGQFAYYLAVDPFHAAEHMDSPAYRSQRILYPALARLLALAQPSLVPYSLLVINVLALTAGTAMMSRLLEAERISRWYALSYGLFAGVFVAVRASTTEPLAYAFVLAAILAARRERIVWSALLLLLAVFTRETTLLFAAGYGLYYAAQRQWRRLAIVALIVAVPFAVWQLILYGQFGMFGLASGGAGATPFEIIPFNGIWQILAQGLPTFFAFGLLPMLIAFVPTVWALWQVWGDLHAGRRHPYVFLLLANAAVMPFLPFSTYREPLGLFRFLVGLVVSTVLYSAWHKAYRPLRYSVLWLLFGLTVFA